MLTARTADEPGRFREPKILSHSRVNRKGRLEISLRIVV
jgi:hypothetical protein